MNARTAGRIERGTERIASALFAGAVGFAAYVFLGPVAGEVQLRLLAGGAALAAFLLSGIAMRAAPNRGSSFAPPVFSLADFGAFEPDELLLSAEDRLAPEELLLTEEDRITEAGEPLLLDDVLTKMGPDSRVVRLFDRNSMPTPGQLQSRIDNHIGHRQSVAPDASEALSEALAELRRSLR
jgi:hypothetical protein